MSCTDKVALHLSPADIPVISDKGRGTRAGITPVGTGVSVA